MYLRLPALLIILLAFGLSLGLRLVEIPAWQQPQLRVDGAPLLATWDSYFFLAGAKGTARPNPVHEPFFQFTRLLQKITGLTYKQLGFWMPVFLAPLVILPLAGLALREKMPEAILPMGIAAACTPGFLFRTRVGFYDHDMLSLLLPVLFASGLLLLLQTGLQLQPGRNTARSADASLVSDALPKGLAACLLTGLVGWLYISFYASGRPILLAITGMGLGLALLLGSTARPRAIWGLIVGLTALLALRPLWGIGLLGLLLIGVKWPGNPLQRPAVFWSLITAGFLLVGGGLELHAVWHEIILQTAKYAPAYQPAVETRLLLPQATASVLEAQTLPVKNTFAMAGGRWWLFLAGIAGFGYLVWQRPLYLLFLPLLALGLGAIVLGVRFSMYGGVPTGLGLGLGLGLLLQHLKLRPALRTAGLSFLALLLIGLLFSSFKTVPAVPAIPREYAQTLLQTRDLTPPDARIWTWWDFGYAAQYYAERAVFADGEMNAPDRIYPLALVHATTSPRQSAQMIRAVTASQLQQRSPGNNGGRTPWNVYRAPPLTFLEGLDPDAAHNRINALTTSHFTFEPDAPPQYLLLAWENIRLAGWIIHFGQWDLRYGRGGKGRAERLSGYLNADMHAGILKLDSGRHIRIDALLTVLNGTSQQFTWPNASGIFAIYNDPDKEFWLVNQSIFDSVLVQMLLGHPDRFANDFELLLDNAPFARLYRVKTSVSSAP